MTLFTLEYAEHLVVEAEKIDMPSARGVLGWILAGVESEHHLKRIFHRNTVGKTCQYLVDSGVVFYDKCTKMYKPMPRLYKIGRILGQSAPNVM